MTIQHFARSEDVKNDLIATLRGRTLVSIEFKDSLGGEEVRLLFDDGREVTILSDDYFNVAVSEMADRG